MTCSITNTVGDQTITYSADTPTELYGVMQLSFPNRLSMKQEENKLELSDAASKFMGFEGSTDLDRLEEVCSKLYEMFELIVGSRHDQVVIGRNVPMCLEVDAIKLMEMFADFAPDWGNLAKKYRELRAQPTSLYAGKAIE